MFNNLSPRNGFHLRSVLVKLVVAVALLVTLAITASAYTLVFRDGRRMEIPSEFTLTKTTLTYEISPGFTKTLLVALLDIPATERANNEVAGSFFKHVQKAQSQPATVPTQRARVTLTNRELEPIEARRIESEKRYERRRIELGLPSIEETRRQRNMEEIAMLDRARERADLETRDEAYWRDRARSLRNEIATTDAQISYVRARLAEISPSGTYGFVLGGSPYGPFGSRTAPNIHSTGAGVVGDAGTLPQSPNRGIFNEDRGRIVNPPIGRSRPSDIYGYPNGYPPYGYPPYGYPPYGYPPNGYPPYGYPPYGYPSYGYPPYGYPSGSNVLLDNSADAYERSNLTEQLDSLMTTRAGLNARWLQLENEARDARIPQFWLEP